MSHFKHYFFSSQTHLGHPVTICCKDCSPACTAPALASPVQNLTPRFWGGKKRRKKTTSGHCRGRGVWFLWKPPTCVLWRKRRGRRREVEKCKRREEEEWKLDAGSSMYSCWEREAGSSQDLNAWIIHEVVFRYANMNYLTSRVGLFLHPPSSSSVSVHLVSILTHWLKISSQNSIFFSNSSWLNNLWLSRFLSLYPLSLSDHAKCFCPFIDFLCFYTCVLRGFLQPPSLYQRPWEECCLSSDGLLIRSRLTRRGRGDEVHGGLFLTISHLILPVSVAILSEFLILNLGSPVTQMEYKSLCNILHL